MPFPDGPAAPPPGFPAAAVTARSQASRIPGSSRGRATPRPQEPTRGSHRAGTPRHLARCTGQAARLTPTAQPSLAPGGYAGPGGHSGQPGFRPGRGFAGQQGVPEPNPYPGPARAYPMAGGYPGPGQQHAPYPEYQAWHPQGGPGGYPGPAGYGEAVNQADYAYVIHDAGSWRPAPSQPRMRERAPGLGEWSPVNAGHPAGAGATARPGKPADATGTPAVAVRAITAGAASPRAQAAEAGPSAAASFTAATPAPTATATAGTAASSGDAARAEARVQPSPPVPRTTRAATAQPAWTPPWPTAPMTRPTARQDPTGTSGARSL